VVKVVPDPAPGRDQRTGQARPSRSTTAEPEPTVLEYGAGAPHSQKRAVPTFVYWITTVGAPSWPPSVLMAGAPSVHTSHRCADADQRNVNDAAG
jgi:hypothetical protein